MSIVSAERNAPKERTVVWIDGRALGIALLVFAGCYFGSKLGASLRFPGQGNAIVFPPYAVLATALLLSPLRCWWIWFLSSLAGHFAANWPQWPLGWVLMAEGANVLRALVAVIGIRQLGSDKTFDSFRGMAVLCGFGVFIGPAVAALVGAGIVTYYNSVGSYWLAWRAWFLSNALIGATLLPVLAIGITNFRHWVSGAPVRRLMEAGTLAVSLVALSCLVLILPAHNFAGLPVRLCTLFPILIWAAVRFGSGGASMAMLTVATMAIAGELHEKGSVAETTEDLLALQLFAIIVFVPLLFVASLIDERDRVEDRLREREERIGLAAETANFVLWAIDFEQHDSWMSEKGRELFGFAPNETLSREVFLERVHPEDRLGVNEAIERARTGSQTFEIEYRLLPPDGEVRWLITRGRFLRNERGELRELIGVALDVTKQVKADIALRLEHEEMTRLSRVASMGELTASLAHEINQPLAAIASNAAAGQRFLARGVVDAKIFEELLNDVSADAQRASDVIREIRRFVRKGEENRSSVNLNELIREVLRLLRSDLLGRATAEMDLANDLPPVQANPIQLQQVLLNLIMNATEAMQDTPAPNRRILISTQRVDRFVEVNVRDHGPGLPGNYPDKVFEKFFSTKPDGMGMGLVIARSIVEAHSGELGAKTLVDGAHFFFRLPTS